MMDSSGQVRSADGFHFSSKKYPPGIGLDKTCELPFGFLYTPFADRSSGSEPAMIPGDPVLCATCLAYANLFCETNGNSSWICSICRATNFFPDQDNEQKHAFISSNPWLEYRQPTGRDPNNAAISTLVIVMDANLPADEAHTVGSAIQRLITNDNATVQIGLVVFSQLISVYQLGVHGMATADVLQTDITEDLLETREYLSYSVNSFLQCLSAVYGVAVRDAETTTSSRKELLRQRKQSRQQEPKDTDYATSPFLTISSNFKNIRRTAQACQIAMDMAHSSPADTARLWLFTNGAPTESNHAQLFQLLGKTAAENGMIWDVFCTGAYELQLSLYQALVDSSGGCVIPHDTYTPRLAANLEISFKSTFFAGISLGCMSEKSTPEEQQWKDGCIVDMRMSSFLTATHLVGYGDVLDDSCKVLLPNEEDAFSQTCDSIQKQGWRTSNLPLKEMVETSMVRIRMGRFDPHCTISVMLRVNEFFQKEQYAVFQCVTRNMDETTLVTRVCTQRLAMAQDIGSFLDVVDEEVIPVILAKEAVYRSLFGRELHNEKKREGGDEENSVLDPAELEDLAYGVQKDLDATVQRISTAYRLLALEHGRRGVDLTEEGGIKAAGTSLDFAFPPELSEALRLLYHLRRGALLHPGPMQSIDDRIYLRTLFLRLPLEDCLCMMAPSLWSTGPLDIPRISSFDTVPPETLVLWEKCVIAADNFYALFVWSGKLVKGEEYDDVRRNAIELLMSRAKDRFPVPQLHIVTDGDSMSRRFTAVLSPSHGDPIDHQLAHFPALSILSSEEISTLRSKFHFYDPESDPSFRSWFWKVASATSVSKEVGVSLCE